MKFRVFGVALLVILSGCATSKYSNAEKYLEKKQYDQAIRAYLKTLNPHAKDSKRFVYYDKEAIAGVGVAYWHLQKYETAEKLFRTILEKDPDYGKAVFYLGMTLESLGQDDLAIDVYRKYAILDESDDYRSVIAGRLDWMLHTKFTREIQHAILAESRLSFADFPEKSVAILYFYNLSDDAQWAPLQKGLTEMMITDLAQVDQLKVVERARLNVMMQEMQMGMQGLTDDNNSPKVGKLLGARHLVKGSYLVTPDLKVTLDAGIYTPARISAPTSAELEGNLTQLFKIEKELVLRIVDNFGIQLTRQQREKILEIPTENMMAFINYCQGLDAEDNADYDKAQYHYQEAVRHDKYFKMAKNRIIPHEVWNATHNGNYIRVDHEVTQYVKTKPWKRNQLQYGPRPKLVSKMNRLRRMAVHQRAGVLPGNDARESFQEAALKNAPVLPELLPGEPPAPPTLNK